MRNSYLAFLVLITTAIGTMLLSPATPAEAVAAAPSVTSIAPTRGPATGLSIITITGTEFSATPTVAIGGVAATNVTRVNATTLTAITGAMAAGVKNVVVTNPDAQSATGAGLFTVYGSTPAGTWTGVNRFAAGGATAVAISQANNAATPIITVIATVANTPGLIHRSLDRGATWTTFTGPVAPHGEGDDQHSSGWWQQLVASADGQKLFLRETVTHNCCTIGSIWVSSDGGATWSRANATFANNRLKYNSIAMSSDGTKLWATADAGRDGGAGAWKSTDGGATWLKYAGAGQAIANTAGPVSMSRDGLRVLIKSWGGPDFYSVNGGGTFADTGAPPWNVALDDWDGVACADDYCRIFEMAVGQLARAPGGLLLASPEFGGLPNVRFSTNSALTWNTTPLNNGCGGGQQVGTASLSLDGTLGAIIHPGCGLILGVFTSGPPPTVKRIGSITGEFGTPIAGSGGGWNGGGRVMELSGTNFQQGATVSFGRSHQNPNQAITFGTNVVVTNATTIRVTTPAVDYTGFVSVFVTNPDGQTTSYGYGRGNNIPGPLCNPQAGVTYCFQYQDAGMPAGALVVTPNSGVPGGGTTVRLSVTAGSVADPGTAFDWNQGIVFGGADLVGQQVCVPVCGWSVVSPAHAEGPVNVSVKFKVQGEIIQKTTLNAFTYASRGAITAAVPGTGSTAGGATVRITGAGFVAGAAVRFGTALSPSVTVVNSTTIDATVPINAVGTVSVSVTNGDGTWGVGSNLFTYVAAPTVTSVTASSGPANGGTAVTITGTGFSAGASVRFGGVAAAQGTVTVVNATTITVTTPVRAAGLVDVVVTNTDVSGFGTGTGVFTYTPGPTVISIDVIGGAVTGLNTVIITGINFSTNPTVLIGGNAATNVVRLSATRISARVPAGLVGLRTVQVTNTDTQVGSIANLYRYYDLTTPVASTAPTVTVPILVPVESLHSNASATRIEATTTNRRLTGVEARDTAVRVTVPVGAIPTAARIIVEPVASLATLALTAPTSTTIMLAAVSAQALDTDGNAITTNFTTPVTIMVTVPADSVPSGAPITAFSMQFWSGTQWRDVVSTSALNNDGSVSLTASTLHFTMFAAKFTAEPPATAQPPPVETNTEVPQVYMVPLGASGVVRALAPNTAALTSGDSTVVRGNVVNTTSNGGESYGSTAQITVPARAVASGSTVVLQSLDSVRNLAVAAPFTGGRLIAALSAQVLDAAKQPITTNFTKAVTLSITLPPAALSGVAAADLQLGYWSNTEWVVVPSTVQANADGSITISADVMHFTVYAVSARSQRWSGNLALRGVSLMIWNGQAASLPDAIEALSMKPAGVWMVDPRSAFGWLTYLPGAPTFVNTWTSIAPGQIVIIKTGDSAGA